MADPHAHENNLSSIIHILNGQSKWIQIIAMECIILLLILEGCSVLEVQPRARISTVLSKAAASASAHT
eukprot:424989-Pelagomonas_calceolata.AAC.2